MRKAILLVMALALFVAYATQTQRIWDGGGTGGSWLTAENWSGDTLPTSGDTLIFNAGSVADTLKAGTAIKVGAIFARSGYTGAMRIEGICTVSVSACSIGVGGGFTAAQGGAFVITSDGNFTLQSAGAMTATSLNLWMKGTGNLNLKTNTQFDSLYSAYPGKTVTVTGAVNHYWNYWFPQGGTQTSNIQWATRPLTTFAFDQNGTTHNGSGGGNGWLLQAAKTSGACTLSVLGLNYTGTGTPVTLGFFANNTSLQTVLLAGAATVSTGLNITKASTAPATFISGNYDISTGSSNSLIFANTNGTNGISHHLGSSKLSFGLLDTAAQTGGDTVYWETSIDTCYGDFRVGSKQIYNTTGANWTLITKGSGSILTRGQPMGDLTVNAGNGNKDSLRDSTLWDGNIVVLTGKLKGLSNGGTCNGNMTFGGVDTVFGRMASSKWWDFPNVSTLTQNNQNARQTDSVMLNFKVGGTIANDSTLPVKAIKLGTGNKKLTLAAGKQLTVHTGSNGDLSGTAGNRDSLVSSSSGTAALLYFDVARTETNLFVKDINASGQALTCTDGCFDGGGNTNVNFGDALLVQQCIPSIGVAASTQAIKLFGANLTSTCVCTLYSGATKYAATGISAPSSDTLSITRPIVNAGIYSIIVHDTINNKKDTLLNADTNTVPVRYWTNGGNNKTWHNPANWSFSSGGSGAAPIPVSTDTARLDGAYLNGDSCIISSAATCYRLISEASFDNGFKQKAGGKLTTQTGYVLDGTGPIQLSDTIVITGDGISHIGSGSGGDANTATGLKLFLQGNDTLDWDIVNTNPTYTRMAESGKKCVWTGSGGASGPRKIYMGPGEFNIPATTSTAFYCWFGADSIPWYVDPSCSLTGNGSVKFRYSISGTQRIHVPAFNSPLLNMTLSCATSGGHATWLFDGNVTLREMSLQTSDNGSSRFYFNGHTITTDTLRIVVNVAAGRTSIRCSTSTINTSVFACTSDVVGYDTIYAQNSNWFIGSQFSLGDSAIWVQDTVDTITFDSTVNSPLLTNGDTLGVIKIATLGKTVILQDDLTCYDTIITAGTLNKNGKTVTILKAACQTAASISDTTVNCTTYVNKVAKLTASDYDSITLLDTTDGVTLSGDTMYYVMRGAAITDSIIRAVAWSGADGACNDTANCTLDVVVHPDTVLTRSPTSGDTAGGTAVALTGRTLTGLSHIRGAGISWTIGANTDSTVVCTTAASDSVGVIVFWAVNADSTDSTGFTWTYTAPASGSVRFSFMEGFGF